MWRRRLGLAGPVLLLAAALSLLVGRAEAGAGAATRWRVHLVGDLTVALAAVAVATYLVERRQRAAEAALERQKEHLARVLRDSTEIIVGLDADDRIVFWNHGAELVYGYRAEEILGRPFAELVPETARGDLRPVPSVGEFLAERIGKNGVPVSVLIRRIDTAGERRECSGCAAVASSLSHLQELERQVTHSEQLATVGQMAAGLAHEIKNPLAGIAGAIQILGETLAPDDERQTIVAKVLDQVRRIDGTVRDLLSYASPKQANPEPTDLHAIIESSLGMLSFLPSKPVAVVRRFDRRLPPLALDRDLFGQVFSNLFINAVQAMPDGGRLVVTTSATPEEIVVSVEDSGVGMPPELEERIFDPFFTTKTRGTGLGLPICRRIVEAHGGTIRVRSAPGEGTEFTIRLPRRLALAPATTATRRAAEGKATGSAGERAASPGGADVPP